jgi:ABC-type uncharacterized transport system permease subunit
VNFAKVQFKNKLTSNRRSNKFIKTLGKIYDIIVMISLFFGFLVCVLYYNIYELLGGSLIYLFFLFVLSFLIRMLIR